MEATDLENRIKFLIIFILCPFIVFAQYDDTYLDTTRVKKIVFGDGSTWDVNLYRSSANVIKTDDNFEAVGYFKFKNIQFAASGDSLLIIDKTADDTVATRKWTRENTVLNAKLSNFIASPISITSGGVITSSTDIAINAPGTSSVGFNYASGTDLLHYGGGTSVVFSVQETGAVYSASTINSASGYQLSGSPLTITNLDADLTNFPSQSGNSGKYLTTNGSALSWGTVTVANDTANMATKATTQVISGTKYNTGVQYFYNHLQGVTDLSLRASGSGSVSFNYQSGTDLLMYGGGSSVVFSVQETGAIYSAGTINAVSGYQVNGSSLSYTHVGAAASSHGHTYSDITGQTVTFNGILEASSGNEYTLVFQNGILTSYSLYP
jgi:hypothetical protein